jgi:hypothetical protein
MKLSFKDFKFILEALEDLLSKHDNRLKEIEDLEEYEDEASDLENDYLFAESLKSLIDKSINQNELLDYEVSSEKTVVTNLESILKSTSHLSINERLLLVEAITQSIRKETELMAS